jgi:hypothetical protein
VGTGSPGDQEVSMRLTRVVLAAVVGVAIAVSGAPIGGAAEGNDELKRPLASPKSAKLASVLAQVVAVQDQTGKGAEKARSLGLEVRSGRVRVVVVAGGTRGAAVSAAVSAGGEVEATHADLVQALVPPAAIEGLSHSSAVAYVRAPLRPVAMATTGEEIARSGVDAFQAAFWNGAGVKVAIIDLGFAGLAARQAAGDLPGGVVTQDFCGGAFNGPEVHGTGVAEIVHEVAPGAQLYLLCINSEVTLGQAETYAKANGIAIVNHSVGWFNAGRGDGSGAAGTVDGIVADARVNGILWVNSAGNYQQRHWSGNYNAGGEFTNVHDFAPGDETNDIVIGGGAEACFTLKWDDWPVSGNDFDLYLLNSPDLSAFPANFVAGSANVQNGFITPTEEFCYFNAGPTAVFYLIIPEFGISAAPRFDMFVLGSTSSPQYRVLESSLVEPASSPNTMAVGALCWFDASPRSYSSLGPTIDGRVKPDITGLDGVSGGTYGPSTACSGPTVGFTGTSASSPHVAGLAALGKQQNPSLTVSQLQTWLEARSADIGAPGKDSQFGSGRAFVHTFTDTPAWQGLQPSVELLFRKGTTGGCGPFDPDTGSRPYCPDNAVSRDQMAVFIVTSLGLPPLIPGSPTFADVPASHWAFGFVERLADEGITGGCAAAPLRYCPGDPVRREQMAAFLVAAKGLTQLNPPTPTFADVPTGHQFYGFIERLYEQGITGGCTGGPPPAPLFYCPADPVTRRQMAAFLIGAFGGPTPPP